MGQGRARRGAAVAVRLDLEIDGRRRTVTLESRDGLLVATVDSERLELDVVRFGPGQYSVREPHTGRQHDVRVTPGAERGRLDVTVAGLPVAVFRCAPGRPGRRQDVAGDGPVRLVAPMPGKIVRVLVAPGDEVAARQAVVVVEAMKMENELRAGRAGVVREVLVAQGASVEAGATLVVLE